MCEERGNEESLTIDERVAVLETDMKWVKRTLEKIDDRTWWILGSVIALGVITIIIQLIFP
ncbi:MAG: hypothetical protein AOA65_1611 [Candidatus Bathyarchaeota archaeon BA1]|nr:MAG: hypothetical protein AOA65_1611 [Candidatus Bathyarchaeota archaeon BA1]